METSKERHTVWLSKEAWNKVRQLYHQDNCTTCNEFIEKAIQFYCGYLHAQNAAAYLPEVLHTMLEGTLEGFGDRIGSVLYKQAIELNIMNHILAADTDMDIPTYERLRGLSTREVQSSNGKVSFKDALKYQKSV